MQNSPIFYVYIAECSDGTYFTGKTQNIKARENEHNGLGNFPGGEYTKSRRPVRMVYVEQCDSKAFALQREKELKDLTTQEKHDLILKNKK